MPPTHTCVQAGLAYPEVTRAICLVPSAWFPQAPWNTRPIHLCRFRVRSICQSYFLSRSNSIPNPIRRHCTSRLSLLAGPGIFTWFPSTTAFALALGAGSPCADWPCAGTLGLSAEGVLTLLIATHVRIRTSHTSTAPHGYRFTGLGNAPLPHAHPKVCAPTASARGLSPVTFSPQNSLIRPVSYYAFFKGWLLLSQPPGCFGRPTCFPT